MYVYIESETAQETGSYPLYTVGHYNGGGKWIPESDHGGEDGRAKAAKRVAYLNGADAIAALRAIADPNKLDASRSPLPDNLARLALSWLAARPEFENARAVLQLYDRRASCATLDEAEAE